MLETGVARAKTVCKSEPITYALLVLKTEDIHQLPLREKQEVLELLWDDIARHGDDLEMPQWQKDLLEKRERLIEEGKAEFVDWNEAKQQIAKATHQ